MAAVAISFGAFIGLRSLSLFRYFDADMNWQMGRWDLLVIGKAVRKLTAEETLTPEVWKKIDCMEDLAPLVAPQIEQGMQGLNDPWGNLYQLEKREENGYMIVTIRSSRERRKWYGRNKVLGIEIVISEQHGKVAQIKDLWGDN